ncbi:MAG TPA: MFS transporter [Pseudonocardiaceae bacterium]|jgi:OPA family glycerol-3-phosphate transporter-like MFS transporter|nr:MFS transporter [Pseudonocardiaceae bacterium]
MRLFQVRELTEYPVGARRMWILTMAVLAVLIGSYEAQIAPVVPLLLTDLHMSLATYGLVSAAGVLAGVFASAIGGRLTDHVGRVRLLVPLTLFTAVCCFLMVLVHSATGLLLVRILLSIVDGMALAGTAPLVRDFSPRTGRAQAFGFWTWGPVGANFLAAAIASVTLPLFDNAWRSQFVIMGVFSLVISVVIMFNIADLAPELRARIQQTEQHAIGAAVVGSAPPRARELLRHGNIWAHVIGISMWLVLYVTLSLFGQTMLADSFHLSVATASGVMSAFWVLDLIVLIVIGRISDRLQVRKTLSVAGTVVSVVITGYLILLMGRPDVSHLELMITGALLGGALAVAYGPWMANYSEDAEDIDPRLQGSAWGLYAALAKGVAVVTLFVIPTVVATLGWRAWMIIAGLCLVVFVPTVFAFHGPWRAHQGRPALPAAWADDERSEPALLRPAGDANL